MIEDFDAKDDALEGVKFVYCMSHLTAHSVGWCSVPIDHKIILWAQTREDAFKEVARRNFPMVDGDSHKSKLFEWDIRGGITPRH